MTFLVRGAAEGPALSLSLFRYYTFCIVVLNAGGFLVNGFANSSGVAAIIHCRRGLLSARA